MQRISITNIRHVKAERRADDKLHEGMHTDQTIDGSREMLTLCKTDSISIADTQRLMFWTNRLCCAAVQAVGGKRDA